MLLQLYKRYSEPHRRYHTLSHVMRMFESAKTLKVELTEAQIWAIWCHDVVYDVPAKIQGDNERNSALWAAARMTKIGSSEHLIRLTQDIIEDTFKELPERSEESRVVIDLDLYELCTGRCILNARLVKEEMLAGGITEAQWAEGRPKWLKSMLNRESIFVSKYVTAEMESAAIDNIKVELEGWNS